MVIFMLMKLFLGCTNRTIFVMNISLFSRVHWCLMVIRPECSLHSWERIPSNAHGRNNIQSMTKHLKLRVKVIKSSVALQVSINASQSSFVYVFWACISIEQLMIVNCTIGFCVKIHNLACPSKAIDLTTDYIGSLDHSILDSPVKLWILTQNSAHLSTKPWCSLAITHFTTIHSF